MVFRADRAEAVLHDVRGDLYGEFVFVRAGLRAWACLVMFRILQGVGGGGLQPSEQAILNDTFPLEKRGIAFAVYGLAVVVSAHHWPVVRWLDHGQFFLEMDFLHQRARLEFFP